MGMFDYVDFEVTCQCGEPITGFQSKDGLCELDHLKPLQVDYFRSSCRACQRTYYYTRDGQRPEYGSMSDFKLYINDTLQETKEADND